jgi:hypothetical protein
MMLLGSRSTHWQVLWVAAQCKQNRLNQGDATVIPQA